MLSQAAQQVVTRADGLTTAQVVGAASAILIAVVGALTFLFRLLVTQYGERIAALEARIATLADENKSLSGRLLDAHQSILASNTQALRDVARTIERCPGPADYDEED